MYLNVDVVVVDQGFVKYRTRILTDNFVREDTLFALFGIAHIKVNGFAFDVCAVEGYATPTVNKAESSSQAHVVAFGAITGGDYNVRISVFFFCNWPSRCSNFLGIFSSSLGCEKRDAG